MEHMVKEQKSATKLERVLVALLERRITRFDAEKIGCHTLNSSVSSLANQYHIRVTRAPVVIHGRFGKINCNEYWIAGDDRCEAISLLDYLRRKRGAQPYEKQIGAA